MQKGTLSLRLCILLLDGSELQFYKTMAKSIEQLCFVCFNSNSTIEVAFIQCLFHTDKNFRLSRVPYGFIVLLK